MRSKPQCILHQKCGLHQTGVNTKVRLTPKCGQHQGARYTKVLSKSKCSLHEIAVNTKVRFIPKSRSTPECGQHQNAVYTKLHSHHGCLQYDCHKVIIFPYHFCQSALHSEMPAMCQSSGKELLITGTLIFSYPMVRCRGSPIFTGLRNVFVILELPK